MSAAPFVPQPPNVKSLKVRALCEEICERDPLLCVRDLGLYRGDQLLATFDETESQIENHGFIDYVMDTMRSRGYESSLICYGKEGFAAKNLRINRRFGARSRGKAAARMYLDFLRTQSQ